MCKLTYTDGRLLHVSVIIFGVRGTHNNDALSTNGEDFNNGTNNVGKMPLPVLRKQFQTSLFVTSDDRLLGRATGAMLCRSKLLPCSHI